MRNKCELLKWRCTKNDCTPTIYFGQEKNIVLKSYGQHNHDGNSLNKIQRHVLRENCKRRAEESISMQPLKIIRHELKKKMSIVLNRVPANRRFITVSLRITRYLMTNKYSYEKKFLRLEIL